MKQREDLLITADKLPWEGGPEKPTVISGRKDVALTINTAGIRANGEQRYSRVIRFYGDVEKKICGDSQYMDVAPYKGKLYFRRAALRNGFKITKTNSHAKNTSKMIRSTPADVRFWWNIEGDYDLLYDKELGLYYIDISKTKEGKE